jgi:hypothetical protein
MGTAIIVSNAIARGATVELATKYDDGFLAIFGLPDTDLSNQGFWIGPGSWIIPIKGRQSHG